MKLNDVLRGKKRLKTEIRNPAKAHIDREDGAGVVKPIQVENVKAVLAVGECVEDI